MSQTKISKVKHLYFLLFNCFFLELGDQFSVIEEVYLDHLC